MTILTRQLATLCVLLPHVSLVIVTSFIVQSSTTSRSSLFLESAQQPSSGSPSSPVSNEVERQGEGMGVDEESNPSTAQKLKDMERALELRLAALNRQDNYWKQRLDSLDESSPAPQGAQEPGGRYSVTSDYGPSYAVDNRHREKPWNNMDSTTASHRGFGGSREGVYGNDKDGWYNMRGYRDNEYMATNGPNMDMNRDTYNHYNYQGDPYPYSDWRSASNNHHPNGRYHGFSAESQDRNSEGSSVSSFGPWAHKGNGNGPSDVGKRKFDDDNQNRINLGWTPSEDKNNNRDDRSFDTSRAGPHVHRGSSTSYDDNSGRLHERLRDMGPPRHSSPERSAAGGDTNDPRDSGSSSYQSSGSRDRSHYSVGGLRESPYDRGSATVPSKGSYGMGGRDQGYSYGSTSPPPTHRHGDTFSQDHYARERPYYNVPRPHQDYSFDDGFPERPPYDTVMGPPRERYPGYSIPMGPPPREGSLYDMGPPPDRSYYSTTGPRPNSYGFDDPPVRNPYDSYSPGRPVPPRGESLETGPRDSSTYGPSVRDRNGRKDFFISSSSSSSNIHKNNQLKRDWRDKFYKASIVDRNWNKGGLVAWDPRNSYDYGPSLPENVIGPSSRERSMNRKGYRWYDSGGTVYLGL